LLIVSVNLSAQTDSLPSYYEDAKDAYWEADYNEAANLFLKHLDWLKKHPREDQTSYIKTHTKLGDTYRRQRLFTKALEHYDLAQEASIKDDNYKELYLDATTNKAFVYSKMFDPLRAIRETKAVMPLAEEIYGPESSGYANMYMNNGIDYYKTGDYYRSNEAFLKALEIFRKASDPESEDFNRIYNNLGGNYRKLGDYQKALEYGEKALEIKLKNYPADHPGVAKYYMNIGKVYADMNDADKALPYLERALEIQQQHYPENHPNVTGMKGEVANVLADKGQYDRALEYYFATLDVDRKYISEDHPYILAMYADVALVYLETGHPEKALDIHKQAIEKLEGRDYVPPDKHAEMLWLLSSIYDAMGQTEKALDIAISGLRGLALDFKPVGRYDLPVIEDIIEKKLFLELGGQAISLHEKLAKNQSDDHFQYALSTAEKAIDIIHLLRTAYHSDAARRYIHSESVDIFNSAVRNAFHLYEKNGNEAYLKRAFELSEAAKANILKQVVNEGLALRSAGIPEHLLEELDDLKIKISSTENDLQDALLGKESKFKLDSIQAIFFDQKESYDAVIRNLETDYSKYYNLKFASSKVDLNKTKSKLLDRHQMMATYFYDKTDVYIFCITGNSFSGHKISHDGKLTEMIDRIRQHLTPEAALNATQNEIDDLSKVSVELYHLLIEPIANDGQLDNSDALIIVPHGVLHYLSFDILHSNPIDGDIRKADYLIQKLPVYYAVSSSLWTNDQVSESSTKIPYTGFAPRYDEKGNGLIERSGFAQLNWNKGEVENANQVLGGEIYVGDMATEQQFKSHSKNSDILHLAMHAQVNDISPMQSGLAFTTGADSTEDGFLNLYEIYNMNIPAETVIMNACNTGFGKLAEGEGVLSLAHAFAYAGCKSILMNLWLADDQSSSKIITNFYQHLEKGSSKDVALRSAKLEFITTADRLRAHPYFWAGLVLQGDADNDDFYRWQGIWWLPTIVIGVILLILGISLWHIKWSRSSLEHQIPE
jgi:CHAT domain-containing protein/lipopolysaccharide biosynthesis regulator YciM